MTLEQQRAAMAYEHLAEVTEREHQKTYGAMAQKLPALIRSAGLCQALHFVKSRGKPPLNTLLDHLGRQLHRVDPAISGKDSLCDCVRKADLAQYVWLTRETLASVGWYGRLARSEWGVDPTDAGDR
ncbi:MAG TPA: type III-B CRISPR module-associated protein Cmr5 [Thermoanaerobaculia bacterium]|nr:type III-B CRISPR module-associated protein Cmr5 [Thermoanaerobaculia bacterium]